MEVLEERIAAVNAADILKGKNIRETDEQNVKSLLRACRLGWPLFGFDIQLKLVDNRLFQLLGELKLPGPGHTSCSGLHIRHCTSHRHIHSIVYIVYISMCVYT